MAIDRPLALRNAEKLLRQGKLDAAIAEYLRVVEDQPQDWNTANVLGDLYMRAGQSDKAVEQFVRIADSLSHEGFRSKAAALYKKIIKIRPDDEHALLQAGEMAAQQGVLVDARTYLNTVAERRLARGDRQGAAEIRVRLGSLDPSDFDARRTAARARVEIGDLPGALRDFRTIAADLAGQRTPGRHRRGASRGRRSRSERRECPRATVHRLPGRRRPRRRSGVGHDTRHISRSWGRPMSIAATSRRRRGF